MLLESMKKTERGITRKVTSVKYIDPWCGAFCWELRLRTEM